MKLVIPVFGLDDSGKSSLVLRLKGELKTPIGKTMGFQPSNIKLKQRLGCQCFPVYTNINLILYDTGGGKKIRGIWQNYLAEAHGFIFVVRSDATDERLDEAQEALERILAGSNINAKGRPFLLLVNEFKQEVDLGRLIQKLALQKHGKVVVAGLDDVMINEETNVFLVKQVKLHEYKEVKPKKVSRNKVGPMPEPLPAIDRRINMAVQEFIQLIQLNYKTISARVKHDSEEQKRLYKCELEEKKQRLKTFKAEVAATGDFVE